MSIYTRTGDKGQTSLLSGERVDKDVLRVEAYGTVDELNSALGVAASFCRNRRVNEILASIQNDLFDAGSDLATRTSSPRQIRRLTRQDWEGLESAIDELDEQLPRLKNFILPAGTSGAALLHFARGVCRRGERLVVKLEREEGEVNPDLLVYLNRLSDLLFVLARYENFTSEVSEVIWKGEA